MKIYIANLGEGNAFWPICKTENVLTLETSARLATMNQKMFNWFADLRTFGNEIQTTIDSKS